MRRLSFVRPVRGAAAKASGRMSRHCIGGVAALMLGGCSSTFFFLPDAPIPLDPGPADYQTLMVKDLANLKNRAEMGPFEISSLRKTRLAQPGDWMVCVRTSIEERPSYIAVFMREGRVVDRRVAVLVDERTQEQFRPLAVEVASFSP